MSHELNLALLIGAAVLLVCVGAVRLSVRLGLPSLLVYLLLGVVDRRGRARHPVRERGADPYPRHLRPRGDHRRGRPDGALVRRCARCSGRPWCCRRSGVAVSVAVVGVVTHYALGRRLAAGAAVRGGALLDRRRRRVLHAAPDPVRPRLAAILEAESGINDAPVVILVVLLSRAGRAPPARGGSSWPWSATSWSPAPLIGLVVGLGGAWALRRAALPSAGLYPLAAVGLTVLAYAVGSVAHASGFLAVYVTGVVLGNAHLPHRRAMLGFADGLAWLAQIGLFVLLGLLASPQPAGVGGGAGPGRRPGPGAAGPAAVGRCQRHPVPVPAGATRRSCPGRGCAARCRSCWPPSRCRPACRARRRSSTSCSCWSWCSPRSRAHAAAGRPRLGVTAPGEATDLQVETAPLERMRRRPAAGRDPGRFAAQRRTHGRAAVACRRVGDAGTARRRGFVPEPETRLKTRDSLLIVATEQVRDAAERRLRAVSRRGRLARWFAEHGEDRRQITDPIGRNTCGHVCRTRVHSVFLPATGVRDARRAPILHLGEPWPSERMACRKAGPRAAAGQHDAADVTRVTTVTTAQKRGTRQAAARGTPAAPPRRREASAATPGGLRTTRAAQAPHPTRRRSPPVRPREPRWPRPPKRRPPRPKTAVAKARGTRTAAETEKIRVALIERRDELKAEHDQTLVEIAELQRTGSPTPPATTRPTPAPRRSSASRRSPSPTTSWSGSTRSSGPWSGSTTGGYGWCEKCGNADPGRAAGRVPVGYALRHLQAVGGAALTTQDDITADDRPPRQPAAEPGGSSAPSRSW